jgi:hypothetical protein
MNKKELFVCNEISEIREKFELPPSEFVKKFTRKNVYVDSEKVQTEVRWKITDREGAIMCLKLGISTDNFILVNIDECLLKAISDENNYDIKYFESLKKQGYKYLSVDGNHRTQLFWGYHDLKEFNKTICQVYVYKFLSTGEISMLAKTSNMKPSWNEFELRNGFGETNDFIRNISKKYIESIKLLENKKWRRKQERKHIESILILHNQIKNYEKLILNKKLKETLIDKYFDESFLKNHELIYNLFNKLIKEHLSNFDRPNNSMFYLMLFLLGTEYIENKKSVPTMDVIKKMVSSFDDITNKIINSNDKKLNGKGGLFNMENRQIYTNLQKRFQHYKDNIRYE